MMANYFKIIDESNSQVLTLINKYTIQKNQYFPVFAFSTIYDGIDKIEILKERQTEKINSALSSVSSYCKANHSSIGEVLADENITESNKDSAILWLTCNRKLSIDEVEQYLRDFENKSSTAYRRLLCAYDWVKYFC